MRQSHNHCIFSKQQNGLDFLIAGSLGKKKKNHIFALYLLVNGDYGLGSPIFSQTLKKPVAVVIAVVS